MKLKEHVTLVVTLERYFSNFESNLPSSTSTSSSTSVLLLFYKGGIVKGGRC